MASKHVPPVLGADSFSCPHCGALSQQRWMHIDAVQYEGRQKPSLIDKESFEEFEQQADKSNADVIRTLEWARKRLLRRLFVNYRNKTSYSDMTLEGLFASECFSCRGIALWLYETIIHPPSKYEVEPNPDLSDDVKVDFEEAALIVDKSPRGAAALLRLGLQKLVTDLGGKGKNINDDIADLVKRGLPVRIQRALDIVRVIGNNAVHPGEINLKDDRDTAIRLFELINLIAYNMITEPKQIEVMFNSLPAGAREGIERRDKTKDP